MGWYPGGWTKRKQITIDNTKVSGTSHTNFPVLISRTDADIKAGAKANGDDILFTSSDGTTKLDHVIEKWDNGTGELVAWVRIPTLSGSVDTDIYVYYGNPSATDQQNPTGVWASHFKGAYLLNEASGNLLDSTSNSNDGIATGTPTYQQAGKFGYAIDFDQGDYFTLGARAGITDTTHTIVTWIYCDADEPHLVLAVDGSISPMFRVDSANGGFVYNQPDTGGHNSRYAHGEASLNGAWYRHIVRRNGNGNDFDFWLNGTKKVAGYSGAVDNSAFTPDLIGIRGDKNTDYAMDGKICLIRLSDDALLDAWIDTEWDNQDSPGTFYSFGTEEEIIETTLNRISGVLDRTPSGVLVRVVI